MKKTHWFYTHSFLYSFLVLLFAAIIAFSCKKDDDNTDDDDNTPVLTERQKVLQDYTNNYLGSNVTSAGWTGAVSGCNAGTYSADARTKTIQRINYFRRAVGLNDDITFNTANDAKCQQAALMMQANNALSHTPPATWTCYTEDGKTAAGNSNIALGMSTTGAITGYMNDFGTGNEPVGHRRWILYSKSKVMGAGSTSGAHALWVLGNSGNPNPANMPEFIPWPPKGYVPAPLVFARWSFAIPDADFASATVTMKDNSGNPISLNIISRNGSYGDRAIVWEPSGINTTSTSDVTYKVTVGNVKVGADFKTYNYDVIIVKP